MDLNGFTPIQRKMLTVLGDEQPHHADELVACLDDPEPAENALRVHLTYLRERLRPKGRNIIYIKEDRRSYYQLVRRVYSSAEG